MIEALTLFEDVMLGPDTIGDGGSADDGDPGADMKEDFKLDGRGTTMTEESRTTGVDGVSWGATESGG